LKVILWPYKYIDMKESWYQQMIWLAEAFKLNNIEVKKHPNFICKGLDSLPLYNFRQDKEVDICIYNHAAIFHLTGNILKSKMNLFFKPTIPDEFHTTLDSEGYGPFSSITFRKPNFEEINKEDVKLFFETKVKNWLINKNTKWGKYFENKEEEINLKDYYLVLGQVENDEVVNRTHPGSYLLKLNLIVKELSKLTDKNIVVKLHPYMNNAETIKIKLEAIDKKIRAFTGKINVHSFIENAECIFLANSGSGFETMMHGKPIISWEYPEYHWVTYNLTRKEDLKKAIELKWFDKELQDKFLYWYLEKYCFYNQETASKRVSDILNGRL